MPLPSYSTDQLESYIEKRCWCRVRCWHELRWHQTRGCWAGNHAKTVLNCVCGWGVIFLVTGQHNIKYILNLGEERLNMWVCYRKTTCLTIRGRDHTLSSHTLLISLSASDAQPVLLPNNMASQLPQIHQTASQLPIIHFPHWSLASLTSAQLVNTSLQSTHWHNAAPNKSALPSQGPWTASAGNLVLWEPDTVICPRYLQPSQTQRHSPFQA